jgi:hypothetical protein
MTDAAVTRNGEDMIKGKLFDAIVDPKTAAKRDRQYLVDTLEECKNRAYSSREEVTFPSDVARLLVDLAERNLPHRPLSSSGKFARDLVIYRWRQWREQQIANKIARKTATLEAINGATAEITKLAKTWGSKIILKESSIRDRVTRKPKRHPRLQFWWEK